MQLEKGGIIYNNKEEYIIKEIQYNQGKLQVYKVNEPTKYLNIQFDYYSNFPVASLHISSEEMFKSYKSNYDKNKNIFYHISKSNDNEIFVNYLKGVFI
jgi:hypothetical protein